MASADIGRAASSVANIAAHRWLPPRASSRPLQWAARPHNSGVKRPAHPILPGPAQAGELAHADRPTAAEVDQALLAAWQWADSGDLPEAARQARLAVTAALVAGAPALSDRQRAMLDLLEGSALLTRGEHAAGLARLGSALGWFSPPESLTAAPASSAPASGCVAALPVRTTPAWACSALGHAIGLMGDPARGLAWAACAAALAEQQGLAAARLRAQGDQGRLLAMLDQHLPAIQALQQAVSMAAKTASRQVQAGLLNQLAGSWLAHARDRLALGQASVAQDAARQAAACAERALAASHTGRVSWARPTALCHRAEASLLLQQPGRAEADLDAVAIDPEASPATRIEILRVHAGLAWQAGRAEAARALLDQALAMAEGEAYAPARGRLINTRLVIEASAGNADSRAWWAMQQQAHAAQGHQRRLAAAAQCARWLGAADLPTSGLAHDPPPGRPTPGPGSRPRPVGA